VVACVIDAHMRTVTVIEFEQRLVCVEERVNALRRIE